MRRVFRDEYCSIEFENMLVSIAKETGFASIAIADLYDRLQKENTFTPELLRQIAVDVSTRNLPLPKP